MRYLSNTSISITSTQAKRGALILVFFLLCALIDYVTGIEISVFLLYTIPVALCAYYFGTYAGIGMAFAATVVWMWIDRLSGHQYSQNWIWYVNAINRSVCFVLAVAASRQLTHWQLNMRSQLRAFQGSIPICTQCQCISDKQGYWWQVDAYLKEFGKANPQPKVCPDCSRHAYARGAYSESA